MYDSLPWQDFYNRAIRRVRTNDLQNDNLPTLPEIADYLQLPKARIRAWAQAGKIPMRACDDAAIRLGYHPASIWGDAWWDLCERWIAWENNLPPSSLARRTAATTTTH